MVDATWLRRILCVNIGSVYNGSRQTDYLDSKFIEMGKQLRDLMQHISEQLEAITGSKCRYELMVHDVPTDKMCGEVIERGWHKLKQGENEVVMYDDIFLPF